MSGKLFVLLRSIRKNVPVSHFVGLVCFREVLLSSGRVETAKDEEGVAARDRRKTGRNG
ncbi:MAG: hypothetical protein HFI89_03800 [Lachnospiraceae bacterium]|nr:hypothetical protein [Lachnospiraceae bacterium]